MKEHNYAEVITESKSAKEPGNRPGFQKLLRLIESGQIDGILTWHINRLTRNLVDGDIGREVYQRAKERLEGAISDRRSVIQRMEDREGIVLAHIKQKLEAGVQATNYGL